MQVELLLVEECPHADAARTLLNRSLQQLGLDVAVTERVGDYPSPTVLVNGIDVMTREAGTPQIHACRLDVPTTAAVIAALRAATSLPTIGDPDAHPAHLAVGVTRDRIADITPAARTLHRAILRGFAATGRAPEAATLAAATPAGSDPGTLLAELHAPRCRTDRRRRADRRGVPILRPAHRACGRNRRQPDRLCDVRDRRPRHRRHARPRHHHHLHRPHLR